MKRKKKKDGPWEPMQEATFRGDPNDPLKQLLENEPGFVGVYINNIYQVTVKITETPLGTVEWLVIRRRDSRSAHDWRHLQRIKNELCGEEREAIEIYPAESRLVDTSNQYHLFVLPEGMQVPMGYTERSISDISFNKNRNRRFDDPPADLNKGFGDKAFTKIKGNTNENRS